MSEALFILRQTQPQRAAGPDGGWWAVIEDACSTQAGSLPGLFDLADPSAALRPSTPALLRCVAIIRTTPAGYTAEEADVTFADPDAIGWAYQFYQEEAKARTYAKLNSGGKAATRAEIASVTQLFTEPYMVKWLLQNSLGRTYHELYPDSRLPDTWEYYIRTPAEGQGSGGAEGQSACRGLEDLTFMDPCMGSGHFEREAFDMYFAMYREQYPDMSAAEIADRILTHHLHGIDLDPRAAQLAALTLYLRAWELVRDERRAQRLPGPGAYRPPAMNLATTPTGLTPGSLERHLQRHPEDRIYRPLLEGIFAALEQADVLGSLLRPGEQLDAAIRAFRAQGSGQLGLLAEDDDLNRLLGELARHDPGELKRVLLERVARSFAAEAADADDVAMALFGREAGEGVRLLQLLDRQYAVVATNPPYMGSGSMGDALRHYTERHFKSGKRDIYAAFILRGVELCRPSGRLALVTMQSWMFMRSYVQLRSAEVTSAPNKNSESYPGLLHIAEIGALAHLGARAFAEITGEVVNVALFVLRMVSPAPNHRFTAIRLVGLKDATSKAAALAELPQTMMYRPRQADFLTIPETPLVYWIPATYAELLRSGNLIAGIADVRKGFATGRNDQFVMYFWEATASHGWIAYHKGGGYSKWSGYLFAVARWDWNGARIKAFPGSVVPSQEFYHSDGLTFSEVAMSCLGVRKLAHSELFGHMGPIIRSREPGWSHEILGAVLNSRLYTYLLRFISPNFHFTENYVRRLPIPDPALLRFSADTAHLCYALKERLSQGEPTYYRYTPQTDGHHRYQTDCRGIHQYALVLQALLHTAEGLVELSTPKAFALSGDDVAKIVESVGTPTGWHSLLSGYDVLPSLPADLDLSCLPQEVLDYLAAHKRINPNAHELACIKANLRTYYEAGPGAKGDDLDLEELEHSDDEDEATVGTHVPIPAETFLEELAQKLQIHPISVYWLLEELRAEGVRCKPEELRLLEDRLSVLVLRLLGHRWPRQIEAGEPVPSWADADGIIPLTAICRRSSPGRARAESPARRRRRPGRATGRGAAARAHRPDAGGVAAAQLLRAPRAPVQAPADRLAPGLHADEGRGTQDEGEARAGVRMPGLLSRLPRRRTGADPHPLRRAADPPGDVGRCGCPSPRRRDRRCDCRLPRAGAGGLRRPAARRRRSGLRLRRSGPPAGRRAARPLERRRHRAARQRRRAGRPGAGVARGHQRRRAGQRRAAAAGRPAGRRRAAPRRRAQSHRRPGALAVRRAALGARRHPAPLRVDG